MGTKAIITADSSLMRLLGEKLYSGDPVVIAVRELLQNSVDACKRAGVDPDISFQINRRVSDDKSHCVVVCDDNGVGMSASEIVDDFLMLGGTSKRGDADSVGGFGIAKGAIFRASRWWIHTRDNYLDNEILDRQGNIGKRESRQGTKIYLRFDDDNTYSKLDSLVKALVMIAFSNVSVGVKVDWLERQVDQLMGLGSVPDLGVVLRVMSGAIESKSDYRIFGFPKIEGLIEGVDYKDYQIVRLNGLVQYTDYLYSDVGSNFVVDVSSTADPADPDYPFTMSREALSQELRGQVNDDINGLVTDILSTKRKIKKGNDDPDPFWYLGKGDKIIEGQGWLDPGDVGLEWGQLEGLIKSLQAASNKLRLRRGHSSVMFEVDNSYSEYLILMNDWEGMPQVKDLKILLMWAFLVSLVECEAFAIGLTGDPYEVGARMSQGDKVFYLINPKKFYDLDRRALPFALWALACHEVAHSDHSRHDERFTSRESELSRDSALAFYNGLKVCRQIIRRKLV